MKYSCALTCTATCAKGVAGISACVYDWSRGCYAVLSNQDIQIAAPAGRVVPRYITSAFSILLLYLFPYPLLYSLLRFLVCKLYIYIYIYILSYLRFYISFYIAFACLIMLPFLFFFSLNVGDRSIAKMQGQRAHSRSLPQSLACTLSPSCGRALS